MRKSESGFYYPPDREIVLSGGFSDVRVFMTDKGNNQQKWSDTKMQGILKLVMVQDVGVPVVNIRLSGTDPAGAEKGIILEYELSTNFVYQDLNETLLALQIAQRGEFLGFLFAKQSDK